MNERTRFNIEEQARIIRDRARGACQKCERRGWQMAHRIGKGEDNQDMIRNMLREQGREVDNAVIELIVHHRWNIAWSCDTCNDSFNIGNNPEAARALLERIWEDLMIRHYIYFNEEKGFWCVKQ
jgi:hypothetical protein